MELSKRAF